MSSHCYHQSFQLVPSLVLVVPYKHMLLSTPLLLGIPEEDLCIYLVFSANPGHFDLPGLLASSPQFTESSWLCIGPLRYMLWKCSGQDAKAIEGLTSFIFCLVGSTILPLSVLHVLKYILFFSHFWLFQAGG